jgi:large subunit ribosomal protein L10
MENPRPEKVAVVAEVRARLEGAPAAILTEYRGLSVAELAELRRALSAVGGDYKVYKNTLVKLAIAGGQHEPLADLLVGPTGIAFVSGEVSAVAKALRDFSRANAHLIVKGGVYSDGYLSASDLGVLADLPSRDVLLGRIAGGIAAPMQQMAGLLGAVLRNFAYGLSALVDERGGVPAEPAAAEAPTPAEAEAADAEVEAADAATEAPAEAETTTEAPAEAETTTEAEAATEPVAEAEAEPVAEAEAEAEAAPEAEAEQTPEA